MWCQRYSARLSGLRPLCPTQERKGKVVLLLVVHSDHTQFCPAPAGPLGRATGSASLLLLQSVILCISSQPTSRTRWELDATVRVGGYRAVWLASRMCRVSSVVKTETFVVKIPPRALRTATHSHFSPLLLPHPLKMAECLGTLLWCSSSSSFSHCTRLLYTCRNTCKTMMPAAIMKTNRHSTHLRSAACLWTTHTVTTVTTTAQTSSGWLHRTTMNLALSARTHSSRRDIDTTHARTYELIQSTQHQHT